MLPFVGAPVYPTAVARTPGCLRRVSDGSQKQPMPKVASRVANRDVALFFLLVVVVDCVPPLLFAIGGAADADANAGSGSDEEDG